ncbi:hypothetical protein [Lysinibacter sp. HNR]|uniref:hypothetical protein n=1 Tax=Lysinibacter sp. HNR TaxID=3031408 RepID=UPI002434BB90|nr:hypothetical protein [Lysinibacter sp. HNR]WGD38487.1 hypothetical protein FrondiHNR_06140 [Lysinibacter sp. HNR]
MTTDRMIGTALHLNPSPAHEDKLKRYHAYQEHAEPTGLRDGPHHIITGGRHEGKTHLALQWLLDPAATKKRILIVNNEGMAASFKGRANLPLSSDRIISYRTLPRHQRNHQPGTVEYGIDDTTYILTNLLGLKQEPHLLTITTAAPWQ